jgi:NAD+ synthase
MVKEANAKGVVIGISGGIDSAVVGELCVKALGKDKVYGVIMPSKFTPKKDIEDAVKLIKKWNIKSKFIFIKYPLWMQDATYLSVGNYSARQRMSFLYFWSNLLNYLVVGTTDKSENFIGYFTKYGDGGVDFEPIIHLTKLRLEN